MHDGIRLLAGIKIIVCHNQIVTPLDHLSKKHNNWFHWISSQPLINSFVVEAPLARKS